MTRRRKRWSAIESTMRAGDHSFLIAGVDEVGRGPLAGPVVACAVIMPPHARAISGVDDSKRLSRDARDRLAAIIRSRALAIGVGGASVREVDTLNILRATTLAMNRALRALRLQPNGVVVDGSPVAGLELPHLAVTGGDARCYSVACASIVAKVLRDSLMRRLHQRYPSYAWGSNVGYGTRAHMDAIKRVGITPHHRVSFLGALLTEPPPVSTG